MRPLLDTALAVWRLNRRPGCICRWCRPDPVLSQYPGAWGPAPGGRVVFYDDNTDMFAGCQASPIGRTLGGAPVYGATTPPTPSVVRVLRMVNGAPQWCNPDEHTDAPYYAADQDARVVPYTPRASAPCVCARCNTANPHAEPNRPDGSYVCYECR